MHSSSCNHNPCAEPPKHLSLIEGIPTAQESREGGFRSGLISYLSLGGRTMAENTPALSPREAREQLLPIKIGAEVVGPDGLRGTLVWIGHDRVGISQDGSQKPLYEDKEKIHPIYPGLEPGVGPKRGWVQLLSDHVKITRRGLPRKVTASGESQMALKGPFFGWRELA